MVGKAFLDVALVGFIILLAAMLVQSVQEKEKGSLTELYFTGLALPDMVGNTIPVAFTVHNLENRKVEYRADIIAELYVGKNASRNITLDSISIPIDSGNMSMQSRIYDIGEDFTRMKLRVLLRWEGEEQEISHWARSASYILPYEGLGEGTTECLTYTNHVQSLDKISITATGTEAQGHPIMQVWLDGKMSGEYVIEGTQRIDLSPSAAIGNHYLDIVFINDYYNKTTGEDRNLYVEQVFAQGRPLRPSFIDSGKGIKAFDCLDEATGLQGEGAARHRIAVGGPR